MDQYILALDQGTTSSKAIIFDHSGKIKSSNQKEFKQIFPHPGWVEHNAEEIWESQVAVAKAAMSGAGLTARQISAIGITNQRETVVLWHKKSGKPLYNAIVWQCRRTTGICQELKENGHEDIFLHKTGLRIDPYFSGTKLKWLLDNIAGARRMAQNGELCFGTIDSWLIFNLTGRHVTDPTNASRTLLFNINNGEWDEQLLDILNIPCELLPQVIPSCGDFGCSRREIFGSEIQIGGVAGDQQAALFGQACFEKGDIKNTYGTGCFTLINTGREPVISKNRLLTTVAWDLGNGLEYALEGSVFIGGAVIQWLRDQLMILERASDSENIAHSVENTGGVYVVPAFVGLGAPYWDPLTRGTIVGITRGTSRAHLIRAASESIAFQSRDLIKAIEADFGQHIDILKADGGASCNSFLMQFQADILGIPVVLPENTESTALGAAYLAGLFCAFWRDQEEIKENWKIKRRYTPEFKTELRNKLIYGWQSAVTAARSFKISQ